MAVLVIDDFVCSDDVLNLARHLLDALASGNIDALVSPGTLHLTKGSSVISDVALSDLVRVDDDYVCRDEHHREGCACRRDAAHTEPRQLRLLEVERHLGPVPYIACPRQGTHLALTECWMCWCDVQRGALTREEALAF